MRPCGRGIGRARQTGPFRDGDAFVDRLCGGVRCGDAVALLARDGGGRRSIAGRRAGRNRATACFETGRTALFTKAPSIT